MESEISQFQTLSRKLNPSGVKDSLPFSCTVSHVNEKGMEEEVSVSLMLLYSSDTVYVYEVPHIVSKDINDVTFNLCCQMSMQSNILTMKNYINSDDSKTIFLVAFEDGRLSSMTYNYNLASFETLTIHKIENKESNVLLQYTTGRKTKPLVRVDISKHMGNFLDGKGFAVLRDSCLLSFHLLKKAGRQLSIDTRTLHTGAIILRKEYFAAEPASSRRESCIRTRCTSTSEYWRLRT